LPPDHHIIAVLDVVIDHGLAFDLEGVEIVAVEHVFEFKPLGVFQGLCRTTGGDMPQERQTGPGRMVILQLNRPRRVFLALDIAFLFQRLQMAHDAIGRADVERLTDFAHGRPVAARLDLLTDEIVDLPLPLRQLAQVWHGSLLLHEGGHKRTYTMYLSILSYART
jgi:hypothetical protein